ncbi:hypothetical protein HDU97_009840 [Phlyctochytrium planicorne]|nr:hypothetical protein HDU97_009840 [Phlyctochytrium planicorne]
MNLQSVVAVAAAAAAANAAYIMVKAYWRARNFKRLNPGIKVYPMVPNWMTRFPQDWEIIEKFKPFEGCVADSFAIVSSNRIFVQLANPELAHQVMNVRYKEFPKPIHDYGLLNVFGLNIVSTEGEHWRRHRKISAPQFSERNNALVHDEAIRSAHMMFKAWEESAIDGGKDLTKDGFDIDVSKDMMRFALTVISSALFDMQLQWGKNVETKSITGNHKISFQQSLETMLQNLGLWIVLPKFMFNLPFKIFRDTRLAVAEFQLYLKEILEKARNTDEKKANLLYMLVNAADMEENAANGLSEEELAGNAFIFILAGHETTAGTLQFALACLAEHPDIQEKLHNHVKEVVGNEDAPTFKNYSELVYVQAVMNETLRMFPLVTGIPKWTGDHEQRLGPWVLPPETYVTILTASMHFHPEAWSDPLTFNPDRFLDPTWNKHAWAPFSEGPRGCLGKKFSQVEFVCALAMMTLRYRWEFPPDVSPTEYKNVASVITLKPKKPIRIRFFPR